MDLIKRKHIEKELDSRLDGDELKVQLIRRAILRIEEVSSALSKVLEGVKSQKLNTAPIVLAINEITEELKTVSDSKSLGGIEKVLSMISDRVKNLDTKSKNGEDIISAIRSVGNTMERLLDGVNTNSNVVVSSNSSGPRTNELLEQFSFNGTGDLEVTVTSSALPGGAATEATLQSILITTNSTSKYKISDLEESTTSYFGFLAPDGSWYILKLTATEARYAKGTSGYTTSWTGRAGLSYDYYNNIF